MKISETTSSQRNLSFKVNCQMLVNNAYFLKQSFPNEITLGVFLLSDISCSIRDESMELSCVLGWVGIPNFRAFGH